MKPFKHKVEHKVMNLPLISITFCASKVRDKDLYEEMKDDVYDMIFEFMEIRDMAIRIWDKTEHLSFYYLPIDKNFVQLKLIRAYLDNMKEFCKGLHIYIAEFDNGTNIYNIKSNGDIQEKCKTNVSK